MHLLGVDFTKPDAFVRRRISKMCHLVFVSLYKFVPVSPFKCAILCTSIAALWFVTINVQLQINAQSLFLLCRWLFVCLFFCFLHVSLCVSSISGPCCQCPAIVCLRAAHLCSHHSYSSEQCCLCLSVPHQSDCSQLRQSPSVLLPLYWPKLTAGGQVRATAGPEYSEYNIIKTNQSHKKPVWLYLQLSESLSTISNSPSTSGPSIVTITFFATLCACFPTLPPAPPTPPKSLCFSLLPLPGVTNSWN